MESTSFTSDRQTPTAIHQPATSKGLSEEDSEAGEKVKRGESENAMKLGLLGRARVVAIGSPKQEEHRLEVLRWSIHRNEMGFCEGEVGVACGVIVGRCCMCVILVLFYYFGDF